MKQPMGKRVSSLRRRDGFTLMEMLVVVIIISILAGVTLKLFKVNSNWQKKEITIQNLGKLRAAIEEYYAQYGTYPPVPRNNSNQQALGYECPAGNDYDPVNGSTYYMPVAQAQNIVGNNNSQDQLFHFGLISFLVDRTADRPGHLNATTCSGIFDTSSADTAHQELSGPPQGTLPGSFYTANSSTNYTHAERAFIHRCAIYLDSIVTDQGNRYGIDRYPAVPRFDFVNHFVTVTDGWGHELNYESNPPYRSYRLWSNGPNTINEDGKGDDISTGSGF